MTEPHEIDRLVTEAIQAIQRDNFKDRRMTTGEHAAISLAVRYAVGRLTEAGKCIENASP